MWYFDRLGDLRRGGGLFTPLERPPPFDEAEEDELEDDERDPSEDDEELDEEPLRLRADEPEPDDEEVVDELKHKPITTEILAKIVEFYLIEKTKKRN